MHLSPTRSAGVPVLLAATGGTERHSLMIEHAIRPLFTYLGAEPVRTGVYAATSDFGGVGSPRLASRVIERRASWRRLRGTGGARLSTTSPRCPTSRRCSPVAPDGFVRVVAAGHLLND